MLLPHHSELDDPEGSIVAERSWRITAIGATEIFHTTDSAQWVGQPRIRGSEKFH